MTAYGLADTLSMAPSVALTLVVTVEGVRLKLTARRRRAWVTLLSTDSYLRGVQCLARALRSVGSRYELIVMVTGSVGEASMDALRAESCVIRAVDYVRVPSEARAAYACAHFADCWTKLSAWAWVEYEQLAYLDADMLPLANLDELLDVDVPKGVPLLAVPECACRRRALRAHCPYGGASADGGVRLVRKYFNAGCLVFRPSLDEHAALLRELGSVDVATLPFAEQDLLNRRYRSAWLPLSAHYNTTKAIWIHHRTRLPSQPAGALVAADSDDRAHGARSFNLQPQCVRNLHFTMAKPWQLRDPLNKGFGAINQLWWDCFLKGAPNGKGSVSTLNKVCMVLAVRARATRAPGTPAAPAGPKLSGLSSSDDSDSDADVAPPADLAAGLDDAVAAVLADRAAVEGERWCLVPDEPAGHLRVCELRELSARELSVAEQTFHAFSEAKSAPGPQRLES